MRGPAWKVAASLVVLSVTCVAADYTPPTYVVDVGLPPKQRWTQAISGVVAAHGWEGSFGTLLGWARSIPFFPELLDIINPIFEDVLPYMGEYGGEIEGVWETLQQVHPNVTAESSLGEIVALNAIYSLSAFCTSIVAEHANGTIFHGRNLDYPLPGLRGLTADVTFINSSTGSSSPLYHGTAFLGYVGLLTGMKPGVVSISVNQRTVNGSQPVQEFLKNIEQALSGGKLTGLFVRETLATAPDYHSAVASLNSTALIAPVYLTVGGVSRGEGAIITRNRDHADDSAGAANGIWSLDAATGGWYRLETNYDHWKPAGDGRRAAGNEALRRFTSNTIDLTALRKVLSTHPVLNADTQYTSLMSAATGAYSTIVRESSSAKGHLRLGSDGVWRVQ